MGQSQSRRASTSSQTPLSPSAAVGYNITNISGNAIFSDNTQAKSHDEYVDISLVSPRAITNPEPPRKLRRMSELRDLNSIIESANQDIMPSSRSEHADTITQPKQALVQSPSGNVLGHKEFLEYPNRPLTIGERQERIRASVGTIDFPEQAEKEWVANGGKRVSCCGGCFGRWK